MFLHGVAFLSWNQHPEPNGSRRATPLLLFQHSSGHPLAWGLEPKSTEAFVGRLPYGNYVLKALAKLNSMLSDRS